MTDKNEELILKFLRRMKEMGEYLPFTNSFSKLTFQRLIGKNEYFNAFIQILRENYIEGVEIFMKANIEVVTQLSAELKELTAEAQKNRWSTIGPVYTKMNSLILSTVKFLVQHQFKSSLAILIYLVENEESLAILNGLYEILQTSPSQKHRELLEKMHARLSKLPHVPEASELKFLVDLQSKYGEFWNLVDLAEFTMTLDFYKAEDHDDADITYKGFFSFFIGDYRYSLVIGKNHIIGLNTKNVEIPVSIKLLKKIKILVIENKKLNEFPKELAQLTNLRYLYIIKSNLKDIPNLSTMFPKLRCLGLKGVDLKSTPDWLFEFARKHHAREYIRRCVLHNQMVWKRLGWIEKCKYSQSVNKEDAAVLGLLEILIGEAIGNDQINEENVIDQWKMQLSNLAGLKEYYENNPEFNQFLEQGEAYLKIPWNYNEYESGFGGYRYTLNESGNIIGLDIGLWTSEDIWSYILLPYFPEEISKLKYLKVLRIGLIYKRFRLFLEKKDVDFNDIESIIPESLIPESIRELKSLRFFWTNAKYSESLKPFINSLEKFGETSFHH
jgi:Leucine-rich repeat (LRR) protein